MDCIFFLIMIQQKLHEKYKVSPDNINNAYSWNEVASSLKSFSVPVFVCLLDSVPCSVSVRRYVPTTK